MKKTIKTTFALFLTALILTGFAACGKGTAPGTAASDTNAGETTIAETATDKTTAEITVKDASDTSESSYVKGDSTAPDGAFRAAELIRIGEHTYYQEGLFEESDRDRMFKDYMITQLEKADKDLHDDVYVTGIGEAEEKDEFRFFGKMMKDGVIYSTGDMTCWYDSANGNFWEIDYSKFRRADFSKNGLLPAEDFFGEVYENASKSEKITEAYGFDGSITGTYLLAVGSEGNLFYRFTINRFSYVDVDAKTGEIILEHYWDGVYY